MVRKMAVCLFVCSLLTGASGCGGGSAESAKTAGGLADKAVVDNAKEMEKSGKKLTGKNKMLVNDGPAKKADKAEAPAQ